LSATILSLKSALEDGFNVVIDEYLRAEIETGFSEDGFYPKSRIESVNALMPQIKGKVITDRISDYQEQTIRRYQSALSALVPQDAKTDEHLAKLLE
jgi:hypothetical protein